MLIWSQPSFQLRSNGCLHRTVVSSQYKGNVDRAKNLVKEHISATTRECKEQGWPILSCWVRLVTADAGDVRSLKQLVSTRKPFLLPLPSSLARGNPEETILRRSLRCLRWHSKHHLKLITDNGQSRYPQPERTLQTAPVLDLARIRFIHHTTSVPRSVLSHIARLQFTRILYDGRFLLKAFPEPTLESVCAHSRIDGCSFRAPWEPINCTTLRIIHHACSYPILGRGPAVDSVETMEEDRIGA